MTHHYSRLAATILIGLGLGHYLFALSPAPAQVIYSGQSIPSRPTVPANSIGVDNSWYLDLLTSRVYGPKNLGVWPQTPVAILSGTALIQPAGSGVDMAPIINSALQNGGAKLACGTFTVQTNLFIPSNSELSGSGPCSIISTDLSILPFNQQWALVNNPTAQVLIANSDFVNGNSNIKIHDLTFNAISSTSSGFFSSFYKTSYVQAYNLTINGTGLGLGDAIAFIQSDHYSVHDNYATGWGNVCYDNWQGSHDAQITNNKCEGGNHTIYGVLINGLGGANVGSPVMTSYNYVVSGNIINHTTGVGIDADGLNAGPNTGVVSHIAIANNLIDDVSGGTFNPNYFGILLSNGNDLTAVGNHISNTARAGIRVGAATGTLSNVRVANNLIDTTNTIAAGTNSAIEVAASVTGASLSHDTIIGSTQKYAVSILTGATGTVVDEQNLPTGLAIGNVAPGISDGGSGTIIVNQPNYTLVACHLPMILPSSGSMGDNGALTLTTALAKTYPTAYIYLPANAISSGSTAGWYYYVASSGSAGTVYNNTYTINTCAIPPSPTPFVTTGPGAYTQTTSANIVALDYSVPANSLGPNGSMEAKGVITNSNSANSKFIKGIFGTMTFAQATTTTNTMYGFDAGFSNMASTNAQVSFLNSSTFATGGGANTPVNGTNDTTGLVSMALALEITNAVDYIVLENSMFIKLPGQQ